MNLRIRQCYGIISELQTDGPLGGLFSEFNLARNCDIRKLLKMPLLSLNLVIMMKLIVIFKQETTEILESVAP